MNIRAALVEKYGEGYVNNVAKEIEKAVRSLYPQKVCKYKQKGKITYFEIIFACQFKAAKNIEKLKNSGDWFQEGGQSLKTAYYTTQKTHKTYRKPDDKNINNILFLLNDFPLVQEFAESELDKL